MQPHSRTADASVSPLTVKLRDRIARSGPIPVSEYMRIALTDEEYGYYTHFSAEKDPLGAAGDFTTAPEISQVFGELVAVWCACAWQALGGPSSLTLIELGPGRGTLMRDMLRTLGKVAPQLRDALKMILVEVSPTLRERQSLALANCGGTPVEWQTDLPQLPDTPWLLVANEFLDALPIAQAIRTADGWRERMVALDGQGQFVFAEGAPVEFPQAPVQAKPGDIYEYCPAAHDWMRKLGRALTQTPGAALFVDYGYAGAEWGDSLQAVKAHKPHPVLEQPGGADLTAHVDFARLASTAEAAGAHVWGPATQGVFLQRLGIAERAERLLHVTTGHKREAVASGIWRLIGEDAMGRLFKVMALTSPNVKDIPGF